MPVIKIIRDSWLVVMWFCIRRSIKIAVRPAPISCRNRDMINLSSMDTMLPLLCLACFLLAGGYFFLFFVESVLKKGD